MKRPKQCSARPGKRAPHFQPPKEDDAKDDRRRDENKIPHHALGGRKRECRPQEEGVEREQQLRRSCHSLQNHVFLHWR